MKWYKRNPARFECELALLKRHYPKTRFFNQKGKLTIYLKIPGKKDNYLAKVIYPDDFPYEQPKAYIVEPKIDNLYEKIHMFRDGSLCLARPEQMGPQTSGKVICDWVRKWLESYEMWLSTGKFPKGH